MKCPVCETVDLRMSERQGVEIDYCPQCRGVWLDRGELDKIIERAAQADTGYSVPVQAEKRKRGERVLDDADEYYDDDDRRYHSPKRRRRSFLDDVFDIFD
jgi:Zn-finger nucleic acid-binding protein